MADGLVEHVVGIELAGELPPGPCKPLRQRPGAALALVELASLQGAARRAGDLLGQRELLVVEHLFACEEDEHEPDAAARRLRQGHGQQRAPVRPPLPPGEPFAEAAVVDQPVRREQLAAASTRRQRGRVLPEVVGERSASSYEPASSSSSRTARSTAAESPPSASAAACATASWVASADSGSLSTAAIR